MECLSMSWRVSAGWEDGEYVSISTGVHLWRTLYGWVQTWVTNKLFSSWQRPLCWQVDKGLCDWNILFWSTVDYIPFSDVVWLSWVIVSLKVTSQEWLNRSLKPLQLNSCHHQWHTHTHTAESNISFLAYLSEFIPLFGRCHWYWTTQQGLNSCLPYFSDLVGKWARGC